MKTGLESLDTGASDITYSGNEGPKSPQQIAEADYMLLEEYQKYVFEMEEMGLEPMSLEEFRQQARAGMNKGGIAMQGGGPNYLGKQPEVTVPKKWKSSPDHPDTELAYITEPEKKVLIALNMHGGLEDGKPNRGPEGVMSLQGDMGSFEGPATSAIGPNQPSSGSGNNKNDPPSDFRSSNVMNPENVKAGVNRNVKSLTDLKGGKIGGAGKSGGAGDPTDQPIKDLQDFYNKPANYPKYMPSSIKFLADLNRKPNRKYFVEKVLRAGKIPGLPSNVLDIYDENFDIEAAYQSYMSNRMAGKTDAMGNPVAGFQYDNSGNLVGNFRDDGGQQQMAGIQSMAPVTTAATTPATAATTAATTSESPFAPGKLAFKDYYVGDSPSAAQLAYGKAMGVDPRMYGLTAYAADGGRIGYAGGGIADLRQGYFLGKLVKKVTRGIKKVAKSPIGKMALIGGLGAFGINQFGTGATFMDKLKNVGRMAFLNKDATKFTKKNINPFKIFGGITALSSLPLIFGTGDDEREQYGAEGQYRGPSIEDTFGMSLNEIASRARAGTLDPNVFNFLADGGIAGARTSALNELYNINDDDEEQKLSLGGSAGLPPVTQQTEGLYSQSFPDDETPMPTQPDQMPRPRPMMNPMMGRQMNPMMARGMNPMMGGRMMAQEGGLMDMGGMEKDYRNEGGFVAIGGQERADDVPARLSKNEFVFTADAVRNAGGGDIDKGAEIMENMMENLEAGGEVSEESQGLEGARAMFATQKRLGEVL